LLSNLEIVRQDLAVRMFHRNPCLRPKKLLHACQTGCHRPEHAKIPATALGPQPGLRGGGGFCVKKTQQRKPALAPWASLQMQPMAGSYNSGVPGESITSLNFGLQQSDRANSPSKKPRFFANPLCLVPTTIPCGNRVFKKILMFFGY